MQEAELEGQLFGRDEAALEQLGREGGAAGSGSLLADFLRSYAAGAAAAGGAGEDSDGDGDDHVEEERRQQQRGDGPLVFEDRQGKAAAGGNRQRRRPVWEDPQDANIRVNVAARSQLRKLRQAEEEAELTGSCRAAAAAAAGLAGGRACLPGALSRRRACAADALSQAHRMYE